jgi:hypothetical protein
MTEARRLVVDHLRARLAANKATVYRNDLYEALQAAGRADQFAAVLLELERDGALVPIPDPPPSPSRNRFACLIKTTGPREFRIGPGALSPVEAAPSAPKAANVKGKDINGRMMGVISTEPESVGWSALQWGQRLGCSDGTVKQTTAWKSVLKVYRTARRLEAAERLRGPKRRV